MNHDIWNDFRTNEAAVNFKSVISVKEIPFNIFDKMSCKTGAPINTKTFIINVFIKNRIQLEVNRTKIDCD